jgi:hypothetical protein
LVNQLCAGFLDMCLLMDFTIISSIHASQIPSTSTFHHGINKTGRLLCIYVFINSIDRMQIRQLLFWLLFLLNELSCLYGFSYLVSFHFLTSEWCCICTIVLLNYTLYLSFKNLVVDIYPPAQITLLTLKTS